MRWATCSLALALWPSAGIAGGTETPEELLRQSDITTLAPAVFQARVTLTQIEGRELHLEVLRAGESRTLVRFLDVKERGKYLLKRDGILWFLSPRAKVPVKLNPSYRLSGGASLDDILGARYSREYRILGATNTDGLVALDLQARERTARYPRVCYFVARESHRPVRVEFRSPSGRTTGSVEFIEWEEGSRPRPRRLRVTDMLHPKASVAVQIGEVSEREVPDALFDLEDGSARLALERSTFGRN
jgi:hypothetical protein